MGSFNRTVGADAARYDGAPGRIFGLAGALPYRNAKYKALQSVHGTDMHNIHKQEQANKKPKDNKPKPVADVNADIRDAMGGPVRPKSPTSRTPLHPANPATPTPPKISPQFTNHVHDQSAVSGNRVSLGMPYRKAPLRPGWTVNGPNGFATNPAHQEFKTALANENAGRKAQYEAQGRGQDFVPKRMPGERKDPKSPKLEQPCCRRFTKAAYSS
jgi:hypothetical protein